MHLHEPPKVSVEHVKNKSMKMVKREQVVPMYDLQPIIYATLSAAKTSPTLSLLMNP